MKDPRSIELSMCGCFGAGAAAGLESGANSWGTNIP